MAAPSQLFTLVKTPSAYGLPCAHPADLEAILYLKYVTKTAPSDKLLITPTFDPTKLNKEDLVEFKTNKYWINSMDVQMDNKTSYTLTPILHNNHSIVPRHNIISYLKEKLYNIDSAMQQHEIIQYNAYQSLSDKLIALVQYLLLSESDYPIAKDTMFLVRWQSRAKYEELINQKASTYGIYTPMDATIELSHLFAQLATLLQLNPHFGPQNKISTLDFSVAAGIAFCLHTNNNLFLTELLYQHYPTLVKHCHTILNTVIPEQYHGAANVNMDRLSPALCAAAVAKLNGQFSGANSPMNNTNNVISSSGIGAQSSNNNSGDIYNSTTTTSSNNNTPSKKTRGGSARKASKSTSTTTVKTPQLAKDDSALTNNTSNGSQDDDDADNGWDAADDEYLALTQNNNNNNLANINTTTATSALDLSATTTPATVTTATNKDNTPIGELNMVYEEDNGFNSTFVDPDIVYGTRHAVTDGTAKNATRAYAIAAWNATTDYIRGLEPPKRGAWAMQFIFFGVVATVAYLIIASNRQAPAPSTTSSKVELIDDKKNKFVKQDLSEDVGDFHRIDTALPDDGYKPLQVSDNWLKPE